MTRKEASKIVAVIMQQYPQFYKGMGDSDISGIIGMWESLFREDRYEVVSNALASYLATDTSGYPPAIGQVKAKIRLITEKPKMTEAEAWDLVRRAVKKGDKKKAFEELPPVVQKCIGSPAILRDWGQVDIERFNTVIASNFMRTYRTKAKQQDEIDALPAAIKKLLADNGGLFLLEDGE